MQNLNHEKKYALAVSGGADSMAMLDMFLKHSPALCFFVVTINHNLRDDSASDCQLVEEFCNKHGVVCQRFSVDVLSFCKQNKLSVETAARSLRLEIFEKLDCDFVCLAHNADDNAETVILNIVRGSGTSGAKGILPVDGRYTRPLLKFKKIQLEDYCKQNNVPFVVDQTNFDTRFRRNFVRHEVLPLLQRLNANAVENINRFSQNVACDEEFLDSLVKLEDVEFGVDWLKIHCQALQQPRPIVFRLLKKALKQIGWQQSFEKAHFDSILDLAKNFGGKTLSLPFDFVATNEYTSILIAKEKKQQNHVFEIPFKLGLTKTPCGEVEVSTKQLPNALFFDLDKIPHSAVFRTMRDGDSFSKFGGGTKALNRFFIDKKIPKNKRQQTLLLCEKSEVLIVCGIEISQKVKVDQQTQKKCFLSIEKH